MTRATPRWRPRRRRSRPRVLLLLENLPLARDTRTQMQVTTLAGAGYDVTVVCPRDPGNRAFPEVDVVDYPAPREAASKLGFVREYGYSWLAAAVAMARVALRPGFDAMQACAPPDIYFPLGLLARAFGRPMVYDQRDPSPELYAARYGSDTGLAHRLLRLLEIASCRSADHVLTANESFARLCLGRSRIPDTRLTVVGNGPVLADLDRTPRPELKNGRPYLCTWIGLMGPQDHVDLAVRAVHHLVRERGRTDCQFAFVGDGESRPEAERLARELGVEDWVSFPGFLPQRDAFAWLATADLGIDPGLDDTVAPMKTLEYMAFGLPFVAFDLREVRDLAGDAARYAPPGDVAGFAKLVELLLDDPAARRALGRLGRRRVEESLSWEHQAPLYAGVFDRLLGRETAAGRGQR